jgi:hypothetical protein
MSGQMVAQLRDSRFEAEARLEPPLVVARLTGTADVVSQKQLAAFLKDVDGAARRSRATGVRVDLAAVDFLNSTSMGAFVRWFDGLTETDEAPYLVVLSFRNVLHRPRRAFASMITLFPFVRLEP